VTVATESQLTVAAVVKTAAGLRARAARVHATDVYARLYAPSDAAARKLAQRVGCAEAIRRLQEKAVLAERAYRDGEEIADRSRKRHERVRRAAEQLEARRRAECSYVQRIATALAGLSVISGTAALALDTDIITGSHGGDGARPDDPLARAETTARLAAESIERELDRARRRMLGGVEPDRDVRLRQLMGQRLLTAEQISIFDPSQGSPSRIRHRVNELGL
jgi:hypothetical protein